MTTQKKDETRALQQSIQASKVKRACQCPADQKLLQGARLFDVARRRMLDGIRAEFPQWDEAKVFEEFRSRLNVIRQREERGIYRKAGII